MKNNQAKTMAKEAFDKLIEAVASGKSEQLVAYLKAMGQFHNYSLANAILINFQKPDASQVAGFRKWQKMGRHVKKGEHGLAIMAPIIRRIKKVDKTEKTDKEDIVTMFKTAYVFDISQTEGKPLPKFAQVQGNPADYTHRLKQMIAGKGIKLEYSDRIGNALGMSLGGMIMIKPNLSPAEEFSVLCHELCHEIIHRDKTQVRNNRKVRETEAEAVAFVVSQAIGLDCNSAASDYIQLYNGEKKTLMESLTRIQQTASEIIEVIMAKDQNPEGTLEGTQPIVAAAA